MAQGGWNLQISCDTAYPQMSKCCMIPLTGAGVKRESQGELPCGSGISLWRGTLMLELGRRYLMPLNCLSEVVNYM